MLICYNKTTKINVTQGKITMAILLANAQITWEKLPDDYKLPDDPVDNINQPPIAAALTEILEKNGYLPEDAVTCTDYGIVATFNEKIVVKAPDWAYINPIIVSRQEIDRSYTPYLQGAIPTIVIEFLSDTDGGEYSTKPTYPQGKWYFYEQILKVPNYAIFDIASGDLEVYRLNGSGNYQIQAIDDYGHYLIAEIKLCLGVWQGKRENRNSYWLRWWNPSGEMLLWGSELIEQEKQRTELEKQRAELEKQRAEQEKQRAELLAAQLRAAGIEPNF